MSECATVTGGDPADRARESATLTDLIGGAGPGALGLIDSRGPHPAIASVPSSDLEGFGEFTKNGTPSAPDR